MMRHIVMFRRKADVAPNPELESALTRRMLELGAMIPVITTWVFRKNELDRPICWDYVLESEVADTQALNDYLFHPLHQALVADLKPYFEWAAADYTV
jgi:hypothetical protein